MHCMLMDLLHGFEVLSTTEETLFNTRKYSCLCNIFITSQPHEKLKADYLETKQSHVAKNFCQTLLQLILAVRHKK